MNLIKKCFVAYALIALPLSSFAAPLADNEYTSVTAYFGGSSSHSLVDATTGERISFDDSLAQTFTFSRYHNHNTESELLYSTSKKTLNTSTVSTSFYVNYLHLGGRMMFTNDTPFSTSLGIGLGATIFIADDSKYDNDIALSGNLSAGARYQINQQWALKADLRLYATELHAEEFMFCTDTQCLIELNGDPYIETELMFGIEYTF